MKASGTCGGILCVLATHKRAVILGEACKCGIHLYIVIVVGIGISRAHGGVLFKHFDFAKRKQLFADRAAYTTSSIFCFGFRNNRAFCCFIHAACVLLGHSSVVQFIVVGCIVSGLFGGQRWLLNRVIGLPRPHTRGRMGRCNEDAGAPLRRMGDSVHS